MSKINWKVRAKKKSFWVAIVSAVALFINNITGAFGLDYSAQVESGVDIVSTILTLLAGLGIVTDMTTKGIGDSEIAQTYSKPRNSKDPEQYVDWMKNNATDITPERQEKEAEEYDTSKPFTDDSD
ncbi:MAG: phage holin, partial [Streptococcus sp.]|nr:phage holin [Streptococcus sp.]